jgi:hypothetical protein
VVFSQRSLRHVDAVLLHLIINLNKISLTSSFMVFSHSPFRRSLIFHGRLIEFYDPLLLLIMHRCLDMCYATVFIEERKEEDFKCKGWNFGVLSKYFKTFVMFRIFLKKILKFKN